MTWIYFWDGFESYPNNDFWTLNGTFYLGSIEQTGGRQNAAVKLGDTHQRCTLGLLPMPGHVLGFAIKPEGFSQPRQLFRLWGGCNKTGPPHFHPLERWGGLCVTATGQLVWAVNIQTDMTQIDDPMSWTWFGRPISANRWTHIEIHLQDTYVWIWVDGDCLGKIACDVRNIKNLFYPMGTESPHMPSGVPKMFEFGGISTWQRQDSPYIWFDDFYIAAYPADEFVDPPATPTPIGDLVVKTYLPNVDGTYVDFTPTSGSDHYAMVDEQPHDSDATYVYAGEDSVGDKESFLFNIATNAEVPLCVQPLLAMKKTNLGPRMYEIFQKLGTAEDYQFSGPHWLYAWVYRYHPVQSLDDWFDFSFDANGDPWTFANLAASEFGIEIIA